MSCEARTYRHLFADMATFAEKAQTFLGSKSLDELVANERDCFAIVRAIEVIGEAARKVPEDIRILYPQIPWKLIVGMRHRIAHDYITVDYAIVFRTVREDLQPLIDAIQAILAVDELP